MCDLGPNTGAVDVGADDASERSHGIGPADSNFTSYHPFQRSDTLWPDDKF